MEKALFIPVMMVEESDKESPGASDQDLNNSAKSNKSGLRSIQVFGVVICG